MTAPTNCSCGAPHYCQGELDTLLESLTQLRERLDAVTWERDHATANYDRVREELAAFRLAHYKAADENRG